MNVNKLQYKWWTCEQLLASQHHCEIPDV